MKKLGLSASIIFLALFIESPVFAVTTPNFPSCASPQGVIQIKHTSGSHGVAGDPSTYAGEDTVYRLSNDTLKQCLCTDDGEGIQTNWWKVTSLTDDQIEILKREGWFYVPNGALWGLENAPYMAKHAEYGCLGHRTGSTIVLSASEKLGSAVLAATGGLTLFYIFTSLGILLLSISLYGKRRTQRT